jgi:hypothetical protein
MWAHYGAEGDRGQDQTRRGSARLIGPLLMIPIEPPAYWSDHAHWSCMDIYFWSPEAWVDVIIGSSSSQHSGWSWPSWPKLWSLAVGPSMPLLLDPLGLAFWPNLSDNWQLAFHASSLDPLSDNWRQAFRCLLYMITRNLPDCLN